MKISLPSVHALIVDIPEVKQLSCKFVYNFFEPDERLNDSGLTTPKFVKKKPTESFDPSFVQSNKFNSQTARYNLLKWKPIIENKQFVPTEVKISDNFSKIYSEQDFAVEQFVPIYIQDKNIGSKLNFAVKKILEFQDDASGVDPNVPSSRMEAVKKLFKRSSEELDSSFLRDAMVNYHEDGYNFYSKDRQKLDEPTYIDDIENVKQYMQLNTRFADIIISTNTEAAHNIFDNDQFDVEQQVKSLQNMLQTTKDPNILDGKDYDFEILEYLDIKKIDTNSFEPRWQLIGYIIDKSEILPNGSLKKLDPIIIENPNINTTIDFKIKYGARYKYSIRSVAYLETQAEDIETNDLVIVSYLVSSKDSTIVTIDCEETVPPPNPADVNVRWDHTNDNLILHWNFPPNSQRDIKQWQIFRRKTVDEAFELQKIYNFDDSVIKALDVYTETPNQECIEFMSSPKCFWVDKEFTKDSKFIYSVCSIDAHGHSSNYSIQIEAQFDKYKNNVIKKMISPSGAPKAYPNMNLYSDVFVDSMKTSNHSRAHLYFNPEYLKIVNGQGNDLQLIPKKCVLNIINIDLQEQKNIDIDITEVKTKEAEEAVVNYVTSPKKFKL